MANPVQPAPDAQIQGQLAPPPAAMPTSTQGTRRTPKQFLHKYFLYGQQLAHESEEQFADTNADSFDTLMLQKYRKFFAFLIPFTIAQIAWWCLAVRHDLLSLYPTHWEMPLTMIFGSMVAGMTAEGGGAIAFPVMTFVLHLTPRCARDFSIMIQSIGLTSAVFSIMFMRLQVEWRAIIYALLGAVPGCLFGFHVLEDMFTATQKKMLFVSIWTSFAFALYLLNREKKRATVPYILHFSIWKALILVGTGFVGGMFTSFAGSGVDICLFSVITLLFRVSEKTAAPSTITTMALVSLFCVFWRGAILTDLDSVAYDYIKVTVPIVTFFAPFGSFLGSHFHRLTLAWFVCTLEFLALLGFLCTKPAWPLLVAAACIMCCGLLFFYLLSKRGQRLMQEEKELRAVQSKSDVMLVMNGTV